MPSNINNTHCMLLGECMLEFSPSTDDCTYHLNYAGDSFNVAWYMSQYRDHHHIHTSYITALGDDQLSDKLLDHWNSDGIDTCYVKRIQEKHPGLYMIQLDDNGERHFHYYRSDSAAKHLFDEPHPHITSAIINASYFYCSAISFAIFDKVNQLKLLNLMQQAKQRGVTTVFDSNYRAALWSDPNHAQDIISQAWQQSCIALPSWDDEKNLFHYKTKDDCINQLHQWGVKEIAMSCAQDPVILSTQDTQQEIPINTVKKVVDSTAAGDSFNAGYLMARINGQVPHIAAEYGMRLANRVIQHFGALLPQDQLPSWQELQHG